MLSSCVTGSALLASGFQTSSQYWKLSALPAEQSGLNKSVLRLGEHSAVCLHYAETP